ncbi:MAG: hypothetical protein KIT00_12025 [Rhodospirillales bacterium]|nr:hypothetical protein [Rhodospirillales bacterium]
MGEARLLDPDDVARQAAQDLGAEMDPGLPACVQNILTHSPSSDPGSLINADSLGAFIVATARAGVRIIADLRENLAPPGHALVQRRLQREMGIDEGMSPDHDTVIDTIVETLIHAHGNATNDN